jgi:hypothetical protein
VVIEEGQRGLIDAARHLSITTDALGATLESAIDALKTVISTAAAQLPPTADYSNQAFRFSDLESAIEALTAALGRLTPMPESIGGPTLGADQDARRQVQEPHLARELHQLLREIEAAC